MLRVLCAQGDPYKTIVVARLSFDVTEKKLRREFEEFGPIKRIRLVTDSNGEGRMHACMHVFGWAHAAMHAYSLSITLALQPACHPVKVLPIRVQLHARTCTCRHARCARCCTGVDYHGMMPVGSSLGEPTMHAPLAAMHASAGKSRGYAFIEYENKKDMKEAYKGADGKKIEGRRVLVDVERGRTVENW